MDEALRFILRSEKLEHLTSVFLDQGVTDPILTEISDADLRELGIAKLGERKRLLLRFKTFVPKDLEVPNPKPNILKDGFSTPVPASDACGCIMVKIKGGRLPKGSSLSGTKIGDFELGKFVITVKEWRHVLSWAVENGFEIVQGTGMSSDHPIGGISWYDAVKWCNAKSLMEGRVPVYGAIGQRDYRRGEFRSGDSKSVLTSTKANGFRLPSQGEWQWAAGGAERSRGHVFAGSSRLEEVGWYAENSDGKAHAVGEKMANEIGLHDMSGNVWEWCWDRIPGNLGDYRVLRGGSWRSAGGRCRVYTRRHSRAVCSFSDIGLRIACGPVS